MGYENPTDEGAFCLEMREAYRDAIDVDRHNRELAASDLEYRIGKQWDDDVLELRKGRPSLTLNRTAQFVRQVTGDVRINKPAIKVSPTGGGSTKAKAEIVEGLIRHIEYSSKASRTYASVADSQVACGMGHMRLTIEWPDDSFDAELAIGFIRNPFAVVWDPNAAKADKSDAKYCFVEQRMARKVFEKRFPDADMSSWGGDNPRHMMDWIDRNTVRIVEYWCVHQRPVTLYLLSNGAVIDDTADDSLKTAAEQVGIIRERQTTRPMVVQYLSNGRQLLSQPYVWPGRQIPIVTAVGEEVCVGERTYRHGLIRFAKEAQYLQNLFISSAVETLALQPKPKWVATEKAIEGRETEWAQANFSSDSTLTYKGENKPEFVLPPQFPVAFVEMAKVAEDAMKGTTGIYDAALGARSNETSGVAIANRDRQGDVSTFVYPDNLVAAIENLANQVIDLLPHVYDAPREVRILGEDMKSKVVMVNTQGGIDLTTGRYDVTVSTGTAFTTRRQEAAAGMLEFCRIFPPAAAVLGDLIARQQDWPGNDEVADRLKFLLPPGLQNIGDPSGGGEQGGAPMAALPAPGPAAPPPQPPPPPPDPKDLAMAGKLAAETEGQRLKNMDAAHDLGLKIGMSTSLSHGGALAPAKVPTGPILPGAPGATPGKSAP
jgi:hypothetical protein